MGRFFLGRDAIMNRVPKKRFKKQSFVVEKGIDDRKTKIRCNTAATVEKSSSLRTLGNRKTSR